MPLAILCLLIITNIYIPLTLDDDARNLFQRRILPA